MHCIIKYIMTLSNIIHIGDIGLKSRHLYDNYFDILENLAQIIHKIPNACVIITGKIDIKHIVFIKLIRRWINKISAYAEVIMIKQNNETFLSVSEDLGILFLDNNSYNDYKNLAIYMNYQKEIIKTEGIISIHLNGVLYNEMYDIVLNNGSKNFQNSNNIYTIGNLIQQSFDDDVKKMYGVLNLATMEYKNHQTYSDFGMYKVVIADTGNIKINGKLKKYSYIKLSLQEHQVTMVPSIKEKIEARTNILGIQYIINSSVVNTFSYDDDIYQKWFIEKLEFNNVLSFHDSHTIKFQENNVLGITGNNSAGKSDIIRMIKALLFNTSDIIYHSDESYCRLYVSVAGETKIIEKGLDVSDICGKLFTFANICISDNSKLYLHETMKPLNTYLLKWKKDIPEFDYTPDQYLTEDSLEDMDKQFYENNEETTMKKDMKLMDRITNNTLTADDILYLVDFMELLDDNNITIKQIQKEKLNKREKLYKQLLFRIQKEKLKLCEISKEKNLTKIMEANVNVLLMEYFDITVKIDYDSTIKFYKNETELLYLSSYEKLITNIIINICVNLIKVDNKNCNIFIDCDLDIIHSQNVLIISKLITHMKSIYKNITIFTRREEICDYCDSVIAI
jgi:energy-coupling factor transporter ATP-binding protein EcfA2